MAHEANRLRDICLGQVQYTEKDGRNFWCFCGGMVYFHPWRQVCDRTETSPSLWV